MIYWIFALILAIVIMIVFTLRRESYSNYNAPNDFMKIYYSSIAQDPKFEKKFPFFGTKDKAGLRCRFPNNKGCDTIWIGSELVELTSELKKRLKCIYNMTFD